MKVFSASVKMSSLFQEKAYGRAAGDASWILGRTPSAHHRTEMNQGTCPVSHFPRNLSLQTWGPFSSARSWGHSVIHKVEDCRTWDSHGLCSGHSPKEHSTPSLQERRGRCLPFRTQGSLCKETHGLCTFSGVRTHFMVFKGDKEKKHIFSRKLKSFPILT